MRSAGSGEDYGCYPSQHMPKRMAVVGAMKLPTIPSIMRARLEERAAREPSYGHASLFSAPRAGIRRGDATRCPLRCAPWGLGRATGTCPTGSPARAHSAQADHLAVD